MQVRGTGLTDIGQARDHNEDSFLMDNELGLYIVCDGIGGQAAGEVASSTATRHISDFLLKHRHTFEQGATEQARLEALALAITQAIQSACAEIHGMSRSSRDYYGMGTTATVLVVLGNHAVMGHVGDSRLYLLRGDAIHQLSQDHTFVQELLRTGVLKPEQVEGHPYSNVLTRSLGKDVSVQVDTLVIDIMDEDVFLLCSDGLTKYFEQERELLQVIREEGALEAVQTLVDMANKRGGGDNITVCLVEPELDVVDIDTQAYLKSIKQHLKILRSMSLFKGLSMAQMARVLYASNEVTYENGDILIHENGQRHNLGILLEGQVEVTHNDTFLADLVEGDHFGEMSCFFGRPATATVTAMTPCRCLWISYNKLDRLMEVKPALGMLLLRNLGQELCLRLEETNDQVVDLQVETMVDIPRLP